MSNMRRYEHLCHVPPELLVKIPSERESPFFQDLYLIASEIRRSAFSTTLHAGSGHLGASSSSVEMLTALYFGGVLKYDHDDPNHPDRDRVMLRGHLGPTRYKIFSLLGWIEEERLNHYRRLGGLPGHEIMGKIPGVDMTPTDSLGMELSYAAGTAIAAKKMSKEFKTFVFLGDGEEQEGSVSEAARHIAIMGLDNLVCIMDQNGGQLSRRPSGVEDIRMIWEGYGWDVREIQDGNDVVEVTGVLKKARRDRNGKSIFIISHTVKGMSVPGARENFCGYHTISSCKPEDLQTAIGIQEQIISESGHTSEQVKAMAASYASRNTLPYTQETKLVETPVNIQPHPDASQDLKKGLEHYRRELVKYFTQHPEATLYSLTADLMRLDLVEMYGYDQDPIVHIDTGIREQHLIAMAYGLSLTDPNARILINFAELTTYRAADQIKALAIGNGKVVILAEGSGLSQSRDGANHQTISEPGMILTLPGVEIREPADVQDAYNCLNQAFSRHSGPTYIRTHWRTIPLLPRKEEDLDKTNFYEVGECKGQPSVILIASGLATQGALEAKQLLGSRGIEAKVINIVDLKSLNQQFVELLENDVPILTLYNGTEMILRSAVAAAIMRSPSKLPSVVEGYGFDVGDTGLLDELIPEFKFDGSGVVEILQTKFPYLFGNKKKIE